MRILVVVEQAEANLSAYAPDVPGCIATGATRDEAIENMRVALGMHLEGLREEGSPVPVGLSSAAVVEVPV